MGVVGLDLITRNQINRSMFNSQFVDRHICDWSGAKKVRFYVARRSRVIVKGLTFHSLIENTASQKKQVAALVFLEALGR
jgi:hypothetical protein